MGGGRLPENGGRNRRLPGRTVGWPVDSEMSRAALAGEAAGGAAFIIGLGLHTVNQGPRSQASRRETGSVAVSIGRCLSVPLTGRSRARYTPKRGCLPAA